MCVYVYIYICVCVCVCVCVCARVRACVCLHIVRERERNNFFKSVFTIIVFLQLVWQDHNWMKDSLLIWIFACLCFFRFRFKVLGFLVFCFCFLGGFLLFFSICCSLYVWRQKPSKIICEYKP